MEAEVVGIRDGSERRRASGGNRKWAPPIDVVPHAVEAVTSTANFAFMHGPPARITDGPSSLQAPNRWVQTSNEHYLQVSSPYKSDLYFANI
jgi:hypothetical protein